MVEAIGYDSKINFDPYALSNSTVIEDKTTAQDQFVKIFVTEMLKSGFKSDDQQNNMSADYMVDTLSQELIDQGYFKDIQATAWQK